MGFIPVPNCWQVTVKQHLGTHQIDNVLHIKNGTTLTQTFADYVWAAIHDAYTASGLASGCTTEWGVDQVVVTDLTTETAPQFNGSGDPIAGGSGGQPLPVQTSSLIRWSTALRGRSYRGRMYVGGATELDSNGQPLPAYLASVASFATGLGVYIAGISASTKLAVASRYSGTVLVPLSGGRVVARPKPRLSGLVTEVTGHTIDTAWRTQRRRSR
jgi:hypothetical protein